MPPREPKTCLECGDTLPDRYKGRERKYCSNSCRKTYNDRKKGKL